MPAGEAVLDLGEIAFDEGVMMEVFVNGPNSESLPGARVGAHQGEKPEESQFFEAAADAGGKALLSGLDPGRPLSITCQADGYLDVQRRFAAPPASFSCTLLALAVLEGSVRDAADRPVAGASVALEIANRLVTTDRDGRFQVAGLQPGTDRLVVSAPGFKVERIPVEVEAGDRKVLPPIGLLPGGEVTGMVRDARTKEPISGALVSTPELAGGASATTDEEGRFTLALEDSEPMTLEVAAPGYPTRRAELARPSRERKDSPLVIELAQGGRIHVAVWDEEADAPCQGCIVVISGDGRSRRLVTDALGESLSEPIAPGRYSASPSVVKSLGSVVFRQGGFDTKWVEVLPGRTSSVEIGDRSPSLRVRFRPRYGAARGPLRDLRASGRNCGQEGIKLVEPIGIEPTTS